MDNDLISREALKKLEYINKGNFNTVEGIREWVDNAPTVCNDNYAMGYQDGVKTVLSERPHGEWEYVQYDGNPNIGNWHCSECRYIVFGGYSQKPYYNFCPNCGADMRGIAE